MSSAITTTTTKNPLANHRAPRVKKPPTARNLEIYKRVKIQGFLQWEVAQDHQLHYSRVAQIIKRVERWLAAGGDPLDPQIRDHAARQRLALGMHKLRLARGIEVASMALEFKQPVTTTRRRVQGVFRTLARRNHPRNHKPSISPPSASWSMPRRPSTSLSSTTNPPPHRPPPPTTTSSAPSSTSFAPGAPAPKPKALSRPRPTSPPSSPKTSPTSSAPKPPTSASAPRKSLKCLSQLLKYPSQLLKYLSQPLKNPST